MMYDYVKQPITVDTKAVKNALERIEQKYHVSIPTVYREYALHCDGADIMLQPLNVEGYRCEVSRIIPLCGEGLTFEKIVDNDRSDGFISQKLYPVASDRGGNLYYWNSIDNAVYLLLSDDIDNPFRVSQSIEEFFSLFQ